MLSMFRQIQPARCMWDIVGVQCLAMHWHHLLQATGFAVTKEYYINDAGGQVDTLARSAHLRYLEALGEAIGEIPAGLYPGDYLVPVGQALAT